MVHPQFLEAHLSTEELHVLGYLNEQWPNAATITPNAITSSGQIEKTAFVDVIQSLNDNGLILYEAFVMGAESGLRFIETMITARGRAALRSAQVAA
jgi:DNA-binding MarR family transcriptional regulator